MCWHCWDDEADAHRRQDTSCPVCFWQSIKGTVYLLQIIGQDCIVLSFIQYLIYIFAAVSHTLMLPKLGHEKTHLTCRKTGLINSNKYLRWLLYFYIATYSVSFWNSETCVGHCWNSERVKKGFKELFVSFCEFLHESVWYNYWWMESGSFPNKLHVLYSIHSNNSPKLCWFYLLYLHFNMCHGHCTIKGQKKMRSTPGSYLYHCWSKLEPTNTCDFTSDLSREWMLIVTFPTKDKKPDVSGS